MVDAGKSGGQDKLTREEKLAAKLRENLHRRKAQARAKDDSATTLSKGPAKS